ncbi:hypothetical protein P3W45_001531 [Vairimorpha bombi]|jgi:hypothetical protein
MQNKLLKGTLFVCSLVSMLAVLKLLSNSRPSTKIEQKKTSSRINIMFEEELGDFLSRLGKKGGDKRAFKYISEEEESENSQWDLKNESSLIDQNFKIQEKSKIDDSASSSNLVEFNENTTYIKESEMVGLISNEVD